ncbi:uncharacterized protein LOC121429845 [Lytechinus variegatus]|uniref:uncharacterized protein LOC121429845 n=1 Tax=Lytechinus variegatus TaxID=7654 RepID=UPI001BB25539|nr:uncharacterized protein LOC121429845 [Lytechinus variegatus]
MSMGCGIPSFAGCACMNKSILYLKLQHVLMQKIFTGETLGEFWTGYQLIHFHRQSTFAWGYTDMATDKITEAYDFGLKHGANELAHYYDEWATAGSYDKILKNGGYQGPTAVASILNRRVEDKTKKILDIGSGTGMVGEELGKVGFTNIFAVDPSQESLNVCKSKGVYEDFVHSFVGPAQVPFEENSFDGAGSSGTFLPGHCDGTSLKEVVRLVKPGGVIVIATRKTFYTEKPGEWNWSGTDGPSQEKQIDFNYRAISDELVSSRQCSLVLEDIPGYSQGVMGLAMIYTVL